MNDATRDRLLDLNRQFYVDVAAPFNETRRVRTPGKERLLTLVPTGAKPPKIADIGCGNGRLAFMLESLQRPIHYSGVDGNRPLLAYAVANCAGLQQVRTAWHDADLAQAGWQTVLGAEVRFDMVVCLATLQHLPGAALRRRVVCELGELLRADGTLVISAWQFLSSQRFVDKLIPWSEIGLAHQDVESGDALLPWKQGTFAVRYVPQLDESELRRLACDAGLKIIDLYAADGREGNLNLYAILKHEDVTV